MNRPSNQWTEIKGPEQTQTYIRIRYIIKMAFQNNEKMFDSLINTCWNNWLAILGRKLNSYLTSYTKIDSEKMKDLNTKNKIRNICKKT